jgi:hypothetical protein
VQRENGRQTERQREREEIEREMTESERETGRLRDTDSGRVRDRQTD